MSADEDFYIYEGKLAVTQPLTFIHDADDTMVQVVVCYQACSDELGCFMPQTVCRLPRGALSCM